MIPSGHIMVMAMKMLWSLCLPVVLFLAPAAQSHKGSQGLACVNDFVNNVSCTWNSSSIHPGVDCWIFGVKTIWILKDGARRVSSIIRSCQLKPHRHAQKGCSFVFENETFTTFDKMPNISLKCNGTLVESLKDYKASDHIKMQPPGVPSVSRTPNETRVSWSPGSPHSVLLTSFDFEVQLSQNSQTWKEARTLSTHEQELRIPTSQLKGYCKVRVRIKPEEQKNSHWSHWSPTVSWMATSQDQDRFSGKTFVLTGGTIVGVGLIVLILVIYKGCVSRRCLTGKPVPNPSKYFHTLHAVHGGNLKKWLNPLPTSESFFTVQPCDPISPVEVCEVWDVVPSTSSYSGSTTALLHFRTYPSAGSDTSGAFDNSSFSSSSCFSNRGYFMSSASSNTTQTDHSPVYFTYQDDFHDLNKGHNLRLSLCPSLAASPAYESLKKEPQSPDSGFGIGKEDEEEKKDERDTEGEEVSDDHQSSPLLILPLPSWMCPPPYAPPPPHPPSATQISSDSHQVDAPVAAASGSYTAWPVASAMCRSSSMPVEPCKTGYLTLKELQTTFSNKSI
uniref:interleukin-2 receptor subunit beta n=1 Tax=Monopterus albus TaxID=43700 RepID=UPI0009B3943A|nr:interleukin-2 receptor subunit beta [Monopterus albus]XP_020476889.1 interleukin-2 receptor subunit beta [Monopterus albus]